MAKKRSNKAVKFTRETKNGDRFYVRKEAQNGNTLVTSPGYTSRQGRDKLTRKWKELEPGLIIVVEPFKRKKFDKHGVPLS